MKAVTPPSAFRVVPSLALLALLAGPVAAARATVVSLGADLDIHSYSVSPRQTLHGGFLAPTTLDWNNAGRTGSTAVGPLTSTIFPNERHESNISYSQPGIKAVLGAYVRSSGYYYTTDPNMASATADLFSTVSVFNPTGQTVRLLTTHRAHGIVASGGIANSASAAASETLTIANSNLGTQTFAGAATVFYTGNASDAPVYTTSGDWTGFATQTTYPLAGFTDPLAALEIARGYIIEIGFLASANTTLDISFQTQYSVYSNSSCFLAAGVADFTHTADFDFYAENPVTGERVPEVTFTLAGESVPEPALGAGAVPCAGLLFRRRSRR